MTYTSDNWVVIAKNDTTSGIAFQLAADHQPPQWRDPSHPQQFHLDVMVERSQQCGRLRRCSNSLGASCQREDHMLR